jgi:hypothetical protein
VDLRGLDTVHVSDRWRPGHIVRACAGTAYAGVAGARRPRRAGLGAATSVALRRPGERESDGAGEAAAAALPAAAWA